MSWTRVSSSRSNSVVVSPSTPLAPRRFICRQVSMRNAGVSECANEVKRSVRSALALVGRDHLVEFLLQTVSGGDQGAADYRVPAAPDAASAPAPAGHLGRAARTSQYRRARLRGGPRRPTHPGVAAGVRAGTQS